MGGIAATAFWLSRPQWDPEMRLWKALGDASLLLLFATLASSPWPGFGCPVGGWYDSSRASVWRTFWV